MLYYRRHLPHWFPDNVPIFVTWRLAGSMPQSRRAEGDAGRRFVTEDRELDRASTGPTWLKDPRVADMVVAALEYGESDCALYQLHAFVVMPNHVHAVWQPWVPMSRIMQWLKAATARRANRILGLTGTFWQEESYDRWVRSQREWTKIIRYVEWNPVKAGLVDAIEDWPWSSAFLEGRQQDCLPYRSNSTNSNRNLELGDGRGIVF